MKITKILVTRGRKLHLENYDNEKFEIQMEAQVDDKDDPQDLIQGIKTLLDRHLDAWEQSIRGNKAFKEPSPSVVIKTANELVEETETVDSVIREQVEQTTHKTQAESEDQKLICPKCNEVMTKKEGKDYYLCSKHWGYPDMIRKGQVREKRF